MPVDVTSIPTAVRRRLADGPVYYGWVVVGACFVISVITWGTVWSFGVFFGYIVEEFGLSHANTSLMFSLQSFVTLAGAVVVGFVVDRYGARRLLVLAAGLVVLGLFGVSRTGSFAAVVFSYGLVVGLGFAIASVIEKATPSRWFDRRRGFATGIAGAGAGVGIFAFPPILEALIREAGWRGAYGSLMLAFLASYVVAAVFISDRPTDLGLDPSSEFPDGTPEGPSPSADWRSQVEDVLVVARRPAFGLVFLAVFCLSTAVFTMMVNVVEFTTNAGLGREIGVLAISVAGATNVAGKIVGGRVSDRIGRPVTYASAGLFMGVGLALLLGVPDPVGVLVATVVFGFGWGINIGLLAPTVADLFGTLSINALVGVVFGTIAVAGSLVPYLTGLAFDLFGTYRPAFLGALVVSVIGSGLVLVAVRVESRGSPQPSA
jgi:MFS family permease